MPNKGIWIRNNKRRKQRIKRNKIKDEQIGLLRYITYVEKELIRESGKYSRNNFKINKGHAVQFENKIYLADGSYKFVNRSTLYVKTVNEAANPELVEIYKTLMTRKPSENQTKNDLKGSL